MATNPYTSQAIVGYNASPPSDDGSQVASNRVEWAKHTGKIGDPLKNLAEGINAAAVTACQSLADLSENINVSQCIAHRLFG